jgi:hypothetical protein
MKAKDSRMPEQLPLSDVLSVKPNDIPRITGWSRSRVFELMASGELPSFRIGRSRFVPVDGLRAYIARQSQDAA